ncbi:MAG: SHOCT domain-containing protein [Brevinematia bacterium]
MCWWYFGIPFMGGGFGSWIWIFNVIFFLLILFAIFLISYRLLHHFNMHSKASNESAIEVLKRRYARGEISKEEFEEKKKDIL